MLEKAELKVNDSVIENKENQSDEAADHRLSKMIINKEKIQPNEEYFWDLLEQCEQ